MSEAIQLALFDNLPVNVAQKAQIQWSHARRETLEHCARRYYYEYYGAKSRRATADPKKEDIRFLSSLSNRHLRSGDILHMAIRQFYRNGDSSSSWLSKWARRIYREDYEYSRSGGGTQSPRGPYPPKMLVEFYYRQPDAETLYAESEERLVRDLESFLTNPVYASARHWGQQPDAMVEKLISVKTPLFSAQGKVDLAFPEAGKLTIVDWKTGEAELAAESLQLAFYGLWAEAEGHDVQDISLYYGQLLDGKLQPVVLNKSILPRVRARIVQDLERMLVLDSYGYDAVIEAFPPCRLPKVCLLCPYQRICSESL
jgi:hypothetical protein